MAKELCRGGVGGRGGGKYETVGRGIIEWFYGEIIPMCILNVCVCVCACVCVRACHWLFLDAGASL